MNAAGFLIEKYPKSMDGFCSLLHSRKCINCKDDYRQQKNALNRKRRRETWCRRAEKSECNNSKRCNKSWKQKKKDSQTERIFVIFCLYENLMHYTFPKGREVLQCATNLLIANFATGLLLQTDNQQFFSYLNTFCIKCTRVVLATSDFA